MRRRPYHRHPESPFYLTQNRTKTTPEHIKHRWQIESLAASEMDQLLRRNLMVTVALFVRLEAKAGKEKEVAKFLETGLAMANQETTTPIWFALRLGPTTFGIFDAFTDESGRQAHLNGPIAKALMAQAPELFSKPPAIERIEVLGAKLPKSQTASAT
jgi:quinol monooxygenase YgiN